MTVEDVLFIIGPNTSHVTTEHVSKCSIANFFLKDYENDLNSYDENNPINNILRMHLKCKNELLKLKEEERARK